MKGDDLQLCPSPMKPSGPGTLTPSNEEEDPFAQALSGVGHDDGRVQVAALHEHPEEVGDHKVVEDGGDAAAPDLYTGAGCQELPGSGQASPPGRAARLRPPIRVCGHGPPLREAILPQPLHSHGWS